MSRSEIWLVVFLLNVVAFICSLGYVVRARKPCLSVGDVVLAGPMLFAKPQDYMADGKSSAPWKAVSWYALSLVVLVALADSLA